MIHLIANYSLPETVNSTIPKLKEHLKSTKVLAIDTEGTLEGELYTLQIGNGIDN